MTKGVLDCSRMLRICEFTEKTNKMSNFAMHFLNGSFSEAMTEFKDKLEKAAAEMRDLPLKDYRKESELRAAWLLAGMPPPLPEWDFMSHAEPEKTGILCGKTREAAVALTEEDLSPIFDMALRRKRDGTPETSDLMFLLHWWRIAICCIWAGKIVNHMIGTKRNRGSLFLPSPKQTPSEKNVSEKCDAEDDDRLGAILALSNISDKEADGFYKLCNAAAFGLLVASLE